MACSEIDSVWLLCFLRAWAELPLLAKAEATPTVRAGLWAASLAETQRAAELQEKVRRNAVTEKMSKISVGACLLEASLRRGTFGDAKRQLLQRWRRVNARASLELCKKHEEDQLTRMHELDGKVEPMQRELAASRSFCQRYVSGRLRAWRRGFCQEVLSLWAAQARLERQAQADQVRGRLREEALRRMGASLGALLGASAERVEQFVLEAWHHLVDSKKHVSAIQALQAEWHRAEAEINETCARSKQKVSQAIMAWLQGGGGVNLHGVLKGWAIVVASDMQRKLLQFRKVQAEAEIFHLCLKTGDWIDCLVLHAGLWLWRRGVAESIAQKQTEALRRSREYQVRHRRYLQVTERVKTKVGGDVSNLAFTHVCLGAWSIISALSNARRVSESACRHAVARRSHARQGLAKTQELAGSLLSLSLRSSGANGISAFRLAKRCFPAWHRQAVLSAAKRQLLHREAATLRIVEELRLESTCHQLRWAGWAVRARMRHLAEQLLQEVLLLWRDAAAVGSNTGGTRTRRLAAAQVFDKSGLHLFFSAWRRLQQEEKVMTMEEAVRKLEGQLARAAGEQSLSVHQLEKRLAFENLQLAKSPEAQPGFADRLSGVPYVDNTQGGPQTSNNLRTALAQLCNSA
ncbi:unnamed protein product [Effrenium voratum]|uniref:Sfi1 spindle body domain-containing protein n=1 Tax=Effrenium voratum TaxID=2562239 RepID=A0AA36NBM6_9DINO|nr:unnamed protein product [Effrenium voratum]